MKKHSNSQNNQSGEIELELCLMKHENCGLIVFQNLKQTVRKSRSRKNQNRKNIYIKFFDSCCSVVKF